MTKMTESFMRFIIESLILSLQELFVSLMEFFNFGLDDSSTIPLFGVAIVVVLVVFACLVELLELFNFCDYFIRRSRVRLIFNCLPHHFFDDFLFLFALEEYDRSIGSSFISPLLIQSGGVMSV